MQVIQEIFGTTLGFIMMILLLGCGIYLTISHRFFQLRGLPFIWKNTVASIFSKDKPTGNGISPFQAMTTALAGTMGVGNIAGVATALVAGGAGAIFWMWISAFFGMMTKYAEIYLAVRYRVKSADGGYLGGPMYYIEKGMGRRGLACTFALFCAISSLGIGNMTQINAVSTAMSSSFNIPHWISGVAVAVIVGLVVFGGVQRIATVTEFVIPIISLIYIGCAGAFLWICRDAIPDALRTIVTSAFGVRPAAGGVLGYGFSRAMRFGLSRGVFTNEAGLGSAPIVHAAVNCKSPAHQSAWGIFEVFLDTIVVCTITALVLLCAGNGQLWQSGLDGAALTAAAFETIFIGFGGKFISLSILFFAASAMLGWCYYGERALGYLANGNKTAIAFYRTLFLICVVVGAVSELTVVWAISDILNALMALPNIIALIALRKMIKTP